MQGRTYAHSYHVCKFQGSSANSVGGDIGQDGRTDRQTDGGDNHNIPTFFSKSVGIISSRQVFYYLYTIYSSCSVNHKMHLDFFVFS